MSLFTFLCSSKARNKARREAAALIGNARFGADILGQKNDQTAVEVKISGHVEIRDRAGAYLGAKTAIPIKGSMTKSQPIIPSRHPGWTDTSCWRKET